MDRLIAFLYGLACYVIFFFTMLYAVGFVSGVAVPKTTRHWNDRADGGSIRRRSVPDFCLRDPAQRDGSQAIQAMVDEVRPGRGRAKHLCIVLEEGLALVQIQLRGLSENARLFGSLVRHMRRSACPATLSPK
jgi:hypothetical protein